MNIPGLAPYSTGRAALARQPHEDRHPDRFQPRLLLAEDAAAPARAGRQVPDDPLQRPRRTARQLHSRPGVPCRRRLALGGAPSGRGPALPRPRVRPVDPELALLVQARVPADLRPGQAAPRRAQGGHRGIRGFPVEGQPSVRHRQVKKTTISKEVQDGLNVYAAYYLALAQLENNNLEQAEAMFRQVLDTRPRAAAGEQHPYYHMFRWGANANLARIHEAMKNDAAAIDYYTRDDPTSQHAGNLLRARSWSGAIRWPSQPSLRPLVPEYRADAWLGWAIPARSRSNSSAAAAARSRAAERSDSDRASREPASRKTYHDQADAQPLRNAR